MNEEIMEAVAKSQETMLASVECPCGGNRRPIKQSLSFDKEVGGMVDVWTMECGSCKQPFEVKVPLKGAVYEKMAAASNKEGAIASIETPK